MQVDLSVGLGVVTVSGAITAEVEIEETNHGKFLIGKLKAGVGLSIGLAFFYASLYLQASCVYVCMCVYKPVSDCFPV